MQIKFRGVPVESYKPIFGDIVYGQHVNTFHDGRERTLIGSWEKFEITEENGFHYKGEHGTNCEVEPATVCQLVGYGTDGKEIYRRLELG